MKKRILSVALTLSMTAMMLAGCGSGSKEASTEDLDEITLAIVGPQTGDNMVSP